MKREIVVIGTKEQVLLFRAVGVDTITPKKENVRKALLKASEEYKIVYIFSTFANLAQDVINEFSSKEYPIITILPESANDNYASELLTHQIESTLGTGWIKEKK